MNQNKTIILLTIISYFLTITTSLNSHPIQLSANNFTKITTIPLPVANFSLNKEWMIMFGKQHCQICKTALPVFQGLVEAVGYPLQFGKVNCEKEYKICYQNKISAFPTFYIFKQDKIFKFPIQYDATTKQLLLFVQAAHNAQIEPLDLQSQETIRMKIINYLHTLTKFGLLLVVLILTLSLFLLNLIITDCFRKQVMKFKQSDPQKQTLNDDQKRNEESNDMQVLQTSH